MSNFLPVKRLSFLCHDHRSARVAFNVSGKHLLPIGDVICTHRKISNPFVSDESSFGVEVRVLCCPMTEEDLAESFTAKEIANAVKPGLTAADPLLSVCVCEMADGRLYGITNTRPRFAECHGVEFLIFETEPISDQHLAQFWKQAQKAAMNPFS